MIDVLVLGATGFIGSAVASAFAARPDVRLRRGHRGRLGVTAGPVVDVRDEETLGCLAEADVVVHAAHLVTGTATDLEATNVHGSRRVAELCHRHRTRLVSISTASVYGAGPWRGEDVQHLPTHPASTVSSTRARGDEAVLATGGLVVRPHLVHGRDDRWFVPAARRVLRTTGWVDGGASLHSTIHVDDLAREVLGAALGSTCGVRLVSDPPRTLPDVLAPYLCPDDVRDTGTTHAQALGHPTGAADPRWRHHVDLMALDHHLDDSGGTDDTTTSPRPTPRPQHQEEPMSDESANADLKAKMREALERKQGHHHPDDRAGSPMKAHGSEINDKNVAKPMHRRKAGGGGA